MKITSDPIINTHRPKKKYYYQYLYQKQDYYILYVLHIMYAYVLCYNTVLHYMLYFVLALLNSKHETILNNQPKEYSSNRIAYAVQTKELEDKKVKMNYKRNWRRRLRFCNFRMSPRQLTEAVFQDRLSTEIHVQLNRANDF